MRRNRYPELFTPLRIGGIELRNRIVAPPMLQVRPITSPEGRAWYRRLASGGPGLVMVEVTSILRFGGELTVKSLHPLAKLIHEEGAAAGIQLFPVKFREAVDPNSLSREQIEQIIAGYGQAAVICREAGFDIVEPHGAHGYLLNQFFMPGRNHRGDDFGSTLEGRCRLAVRIVQRLRESVGPGGLVFYRHTPVGQDYGVEESLVLAERLVKAGVDALDISPARRDVPGDLAAPFKARFKVPVIAVSGMDVPAAAAEALREGRCDLVAIGRGLIADAQWPKKLREGREKEIIHCRRCETGCFGRLRRNEPVACVLWKHDEVAFHMR